ncbi:hypothetical protein TcWFU_007825 [Taenia crassiceps]|uniref:Uncharacterized protein n=1 Tax=Taenia crassiceps TaxID=6207 RepID=A0ABR4QSC8_9CEST
MQHNGSDAVFINATQSTFKTGFFNCTTWTEIFISKLGVIFTGTPPLQIVLCWKLLSAIGGCFSQDARRRNRNMQRPLSLECQGCHLSSDTRHLIVKR